MTRPLKNLSFNKEFTRQEPLCEEAVTRVVELLQSGRLHRYNVVPGERSDVALLEEEFAAYLGVPYCAAVNSGGSAIYLALKSVGVTAESKVLCNTFTLAPVPGAIENTGAECVWVEVGEDYTVDIADLERKMVNSGADFFLLSHMRGHTANMTEVSELCTANNVILIEDCAHTLGGRWDGRMVGSFGTAACFSAQTYKHLNAGEGGLLVTQDEDVAAKAIFFSGSYMHYEHHGACPAPAVFERHKYTIPNYSLRMSNIQAAIIRPQLRVLDKQCQRWNKRHDLLVQLLRLKQQLYLPERDPREQYVGSSVQFSVPGIGPAEAEDLVTRCAQRGVVLNWYGRPRPVGFTSCYTSWKYLGELPQLLRTDRVLGGLFDFRVPLTFSLDDCRTIAAIISEVVDEMSIG